MAVTEFVHDGHTTPNGGSRNDDASIVRRPAVEREPPEQTDNDASGSGARTVYGLLGAILLVYSASVMVRATGDSSTLVDGWGVATFELLVSVLVLVRACVVRRDRAYGWVLGVAMCSWAIGDFVMTAETLGGADPGALSLANYFWFGFFPLAYVGVMLLMRRDVRRFTVANYLDGVVVCLVTAALFAAFAFHAIVKASGGDVTGTAVNLVYPVGDLLLLVLVIAGIMLLPGGRRARWNLFAAGCVVNAAGDIAALFPGIQATHVGNFFNMVAWPASLYLISAAVWVPSSPRNAAREQKASGFVVPTVTAAMALLILFVGSLNHTGQVAMGLATATLVAAGVRFGLALLRLRTLTDERHRQLEDAADTERRSREALQAAVRDYSKFASRVADGDLTATAAADQSGDLQGLSESLNSMVLGLAEISGQIQTGVHDIGASTAEILSAVNDHSESANQQSAAIHQTSATLNELRAAADDTARKAGEVAERAKASLEVSDEGTRAVGAIASAMEEIRERVAGIAGDIHTLSERTQQIGAITASVTGLADRSNLLALNASIEAARAGEHGRGFAVVAGEVRDLAEQSKEATAQVDAILGDIQNATSAAVRASSEGMQVVEEGLRLTGSAGDGIRGLTEIITEAAHAAEEIAASAQQQSVGMDEIARSMSSVSDGTAQFVAGAEQSQSAAEKLNELSAQLAALTERYRIAA